MFRTAASRSVNRELPTTSASPSPALFSGVSVRAWEKAHDSAAHKRLRRLLILLSRRPLHVSLAVACVFVVGALLASQRSPLASITTQTVAAIHAEQQPSAAVADNAVVSGALEDRRGRVEERPVEKKKSTSDVNVVKPFSHRVVVVVPSVRLVPAPRLVELLKSLSQAAYSRSRGVQLDVFLVDRGEGLSLARIVGNNPGSSAMQELRNAAGNADWSHGPRNVSVFNNEDDWISALNPSKGTVVIFADVARVVSKVFFDDYVIQAMKVIEGDEGDSPIDGAPIFAASIDSVVPAVREGEELTVRAKNATVRVGVLLPASSGLAFVPAAWDLFLRWRQVKATMKTYESVAAIGGFPVSLAEGKGPVAFPDMENSVLGPEDVRISFAEFVYWYGGHILHPVVGNGLLLVDRDPVSAEDSHGSNSEGLRTAGMAGAVAPSIGGVRDPLQLVSRSHQGCCTIYEGLSRWPVTITRHPALLVPSGEVVSGDSRRVPFASATGLFRGIHAHEHDAHRIENEGDRSAKNAHFEAVSRIAQYAKSRGRGNIAFTLVTEAFVETTYSWICNALAVDALPKALVLGASDASVVNSLKELFVNDTRLSPDDALVVDLSSAIRATSATPGAGLDFGQSGYWLLMLERTALIRDVLDSGVGILHFETDQIWFGNPMPEIERCMLSPAGVERGGGIVGEDVSDGTPVDMVITINTREEASGNFFFLRPTLATRHLWALVTASFQASYQKSLSSREAKEGKWHYIENDQSLFTKFGLGKDPWYQRNFPAATYSVLDRQRFLDGTWYLDFEDEKGQKVVSRTHYRSQESLHPVILNNNFMIGVGSKKLRAQRFGHWFWDEAERSCNSTLGNAPGKKPVVAVP